jgi:hypothetical protein
MKNAEFTLTKEIAEEILNKISCKNISEASLICESINKTSSKNQSFSDYQNMRVDSYLMYVDSENWINATTEIIEKSFDDADILSDEWIYSACVNGEMIY